MSFTPILIAISLILFIAIALVVVGIKNPQESRDRVISDRLNDYSKSGEPIDLEKIEMSQSFMDRVVYPLAQAMGSFVVRFTPQNALQSITKKLEQANSTIDPAIFLASQFLGTLIFGGIVFGVLFIAKVDWPTGLKILMSLGFGIIGFFFPNLWIGSKISRRQKQIRRAMPDALDLLTICVESGLGFDGAMQRVSEKWKTDLSLAFARVIQEVRLGKLRREALRDMANRLGIQELSSFVAAVIQSEQLGVSLSKVLHIQADQMRVKRRQLAEEEAHKAPLKMLIPMALLIFPSLIIVLMTPAAINLFQSFFGGMIGF